MKFEEYNLKLVDIPSECSLRQITEDISQYFYLELPGGKRLFYNGDNVKTTNQKFPLHIARYLRNNVIGVNISFKIV